MEYVKLGVAIATPLLLYFLAALAKDNYFKGRAESKLEGIESTVIRIETQGHKDRDALWEAIDGIRKTLNNGIKEKLARLEGLFEAHTSNSDHE